MSPIRGSVPAPQRWPHCRLERVGDVATVTFEPTLEPTFERTIERGRERDAVATSTAFDSYTDLRNLLTELAHGGEIRVLVLFGAGRPFATSAADGERVDDLADRALPMRPDESLAFTRLTGEVIKVMRECPITIIAGVRGMLTGAGAVLALASDIRIAAASTRFAFSRAKMALTGADIGTAYLLPRLVGDGMATSLLTLGGTTDAADAERIGLLNRVVADDQLEPYVHELADRIASGRLHACAPGDGLPTKEVDMPVTAALDLAAMTRALLASTAEDAQPSDT